MNNGHIIWLYGLSGAGKSTLAKHLALGLQCPTFILDADNLRQGLCYGLGYTVTDRTESLRRIAEAAKLIAKTGTVVIVCAITPHLAMQRIVHQIIGPSLTMVWVYASLETCEQRDVKGLYKKARNNEINDFPGVHSVFGTPSPLFVDFTLETENATPDECVRELRLYLIEKGIK